MSPKRPKYPKRDVNDRIVEDFFEALFGERENWKFQGLPVKVIDTSPYGGYLCDRLLWLGPLCIQLEIKQPRKKARLTDKEREVLFDWDIPSAIITTDQDLVDVLTDLVAEACYVRDRLSIPF